MKPVPLSRRVMGKRCFGFGFFSWGKAKETNRTARQVMLSQKVLMALVLDCLGGKRVEDAIGRMPIPQRRNAAQRFGGLFVQRRQCRACNSSHVCSYYDVCAHLDGDGSLGVFAQGQAGNAEKSRLFLKPA